MVTPAGGAGVAVGVAHDCALSFPQTPGMLQAMTVKQYVVPAVRLGQVYEVPVTSPLSPPVVLLRTL